MIKIGEGEFSEVFRIEDGKVIKLFKNGYLNNESIKNEYSVAKYIGDNTNLAPKVYEMTTIKDRIGFIMDEVKGELFQDVIDNNRENIEFYAKLLGKNQSELHNTPNIQSLSYLDKIKDVFPNFLNSNGNFPQEVDTWLKEILSSLSDELVICHSDYMPYNLILKDNKLYAIDWAESGLGPAASSVARTLNFIVDSSEFPESEYTKKSQLFIRYYLDAYTSNRLLDMEELEKCLLLSAFGEYNWAVYSNQVDDFSLREKEYILANYKKFGSDKLINF